MTPDPSYCHRFLCRRLFSCPSWRLAWSSSRQGRRGKQAAAGLGQDSGTMFSIRLVGFAPAMGALAMDGLLGLGRSPGRNWKGGRRSSAGHGRRSVQERGGGELREA